MFERAKATASALLLRSSSPTSPATAWSRYSFAYHSEGEVGEVSKIPPRNRLLAGNVATECRRRKIKVTIAVRVVLCCGELLHGTGLQLDVPRVI